MSLHLRWLVLFPIAVFTCTVKYQTRMECKNERKNFNCENLRGIEVLVLRRVYLQEVNVNPSCLPALRRILMQEPRNGDCTTFPGFNTWVNGESCSNETTTQEVTTVQSTTTRSTRRTTRRTSRTTRRTPRTRGSRPPLSTTESTTTMINNTNLTSTSNYPYPGEDGDPLAAAVIITAVVLCGLLTLFFGCSLLLRRCCHRRPRERKIPSAENLGMTSLSSSGSDITVFQRSLKMNRDKQE
uniref:Uncharacterized protein LOC111113082 n=1 Tax=Crassostrea virginica TaxID=6565 RepID=A0A8B8BV41_CRAVI|nr:uncharacterized protein LOC111113082 [Crassostrea virginica]